MQKPIVLGKHPHHAFQFPIIHMWSSATSKEPSHKLHKSLQIKIKWEKNPQPFGASKISNRVAQRCYQYSSLQEKRIAKNSV